MNCARRTPVVCGHAEGLHDKDGKCWACPCEQLMFATPAPPAEDDEPEIEYTEEKKP